MAFAFGRLIDSKRYPLISLLGGALTLPNNPQRVAIHASVLTDDSFTSNSATITDVLSGNICWYLDRTGPIAYFSLETHGELPTHSLTFTATQNLTTRLAVTEFFLPEEMLQAGFDEFRRDYLGS